MGCFAGVLQGWRVGTEGRAGLSTLKLPDSNQSFILPLSSLTLGRPPHIQKASLCVCVRACNNTSMNINIGKYVCMYIHIHIRVCVFVFVSKCLYLDVHMMLAFVCACEFVCLTFTLVFTFDMSPHHRV